MNNIAIIPARSGSKGVPDKNIKLLAGKPLMGYSIENAIESRIFDKVFVSTDSELYAEIAIKMGADASFLRSKETSSDNASSWDAVKEVIDVFDKKNIKFDNIMLLQPTSPFRKSKHIIDSYNMFLNLGANAILSVTETEHSPLWCNTLPDNLSMNDFEREEFKNVPRQLLPKYYRLNGAIYLLKVSELYKKEMFKENTFAYIMAQVDSVDIDTNEDFEYADYLMKKRGLI